MKRIVIVLTVLSLLFLAACAVSGSSAEFPTQEEFEDIPIAPASSEQRPRMTVSYIYTTFEEALTEFATDVVIAQYVGHRPFGETLTEFEFVVLDRILGDAADRIFVYTEQNIHAHVMESDRAIRFRPGNLTFHPETEYLLPLRKLVSPYAHTHEDGFRFVIDIVIDLDDPTNSTMYSESLYLHAEGLDFSSRSIESQEIVSFVEELTMDTLPVWEPIRSEVMEDIIHGSPYVFVIEINEPRRLSGEQMTSDWMATDLYYATVLRVLKGDKNVEDFCNEFLVAFFADTVLPGEQHIVAVRPIREGSTRYEFTSRHSLFRMDQLDEILTILGQDPAVIAPLPEEATE